MNGEQIESPLTLTNITQEVTLEISFPKSLLVSAIHMTFFVIAVFAMSMPLQDPLFVGFFIVMRAALFRFRSQN